jgi:chromosomal replication initiation ATPase DnaA
MSIIAAFNPFFKPCESAYDLPSSFFFMFLSLKPAISIETVIDAVCSEFGCDVESVIQKGRKNNRARDIAIYLARDVTGKTAVRLGQYFGNISGPAITLRYNHMAKQRAKSKKTDRLVAKIRRIVLNNY